LLSLYPILVLDMITFRKHYCRTVFSVKKTMLIVYFTAIEKHHGRESVVSMIIVRAIRMRYLPKLRSQIAQT